MSNVKHTTSTQTETAPYTLALPAPFDLKPEFEIELPAKRKALLYPDFTWAKDYTAGDQNGRDKFVQKSGWRIVIVTRKGAVVNSGELRHQIDHVYTDPLSVMLFLKRLAQEYAKLKKTTVAETEIDD